MFSLGCKTIYHHDYYVNNDERHYYDRDEYKISVIQVGEHQYAELRVVEMWRVCMNEGWYVYTSVQLPVGTC
jgi:hypothetical protein